MSFMALPLAIAGNLTRNHDAPKADSGKFANIDAGEDANMQTRKAASAQMDIPAGRA